MKPRLLILTPILTTLIGAALILPPALSNSQSESVAIDYQVACDNCMAQALVDWEQCWRQYNDEGDSECRHKREDAEVACQTQYCIYINAELQEPTPGLWSFLDPVPAVHAQESRCSKAQKTCNDSAAIAEGFCLLFGGSAHSCRDQGDDVFRRCLAEENCWQNNRRSQ